MALKTYDAKGMTLAFGPVIIDSGFADGEFVRVENAEDDWTEVVGADGEVTRSPTNNSTGTVTFILMQSAGANALLSALRSADLGVLGGTPQPLLVKDQNGSFVASAAEAWIMKAPDASFDREATSREWAVKCANLVRFDGGN